MFAATIIALIMSVGRNREASAQHALVSGGRGRSPARLERCLYGDLRRREHRGFNSLQVGAHGIRTPDDALGRAPCVSPGALPLEELNGSRSPEASALLRSGFKSLGDTPHGQVASVGLYHYALSCRVSVNVSAQPMSTKNIRRRAGSSTHGRAPTARSRASVMNMRRS